MLIERLKNVNSYRESKKKKSRIYFRKQKKYIESWERKKKKRRIGMVSFPMKLVLIKSTFYKNTL